MHNAQDNRIYKIYRIHCVLEPLSRGLSFAVQCAEGGYLPRIGLWIPPQDAVKSSEDDVKILTLQFCSFVLNSERSLIWFTNTHAHLICNV